jgi:hypothetical protein
MAEGLVSVPWGPAWPAAPGWSPEVSGAGWRIAARWAGRFDRLNVARVQLIEHAQGDAEQVVIDEMVHPMASRIAWDRVPEAEIVRFRLRAVAQDGGAVETHWSRWVRPGSAEPVGLELL